MRAVREDRSYLGGGRVQVTHDRVRLLFGFSPKPLDFLFYNMIGKLWNLNFFNHRFIMKPNFLSTNQLAIRATQCCILSFLV